MNLIVTLLLQARSVFVPKGDSYERDDHHAVEQERNEDDDDEDVERRAVLWTGARRSTTVFNTLTAEELLQPVTATISTLWCFRMHKNWHNPVREVTTTTYPTNLLHIRQPATRSNGTTRGKCERSIARL